MSSRDFSPGSTRKRVPARPGARMQLPSGTHSQPTIPAMPVLSLSDLTARIAADRAAGRTVALANGCFDVLHVGHVRYLQGAAAEANRLIVAINDDRSVADLKGPGRPILPAADRAELVAAVRGVHYVVVFGERTVE